MKLAISNIAWEQAEEQEIFRVLKSFNVKGIELAPTKLWSNPLEASTDSIQNYRDALVNEGFPIVAMQALLFGKTFNLFDDKNSRIEMGNYLKKIIDLGAALGVKSFVFGSPKNRKIGELDRVRAMKIAIDFFREIGEYAYNKSTVFCIEPNPKFYNCDFINTTQDGIQFVKEVNHPGLQLHMDTAAMFLNGENISKSIELALPFMKHFHISEPELLLTGVGKVNHKEISHCLKSIGYKGFLSIEMKANQGRSNIETVTKSLQYTNEVYFR